MGGKIQTEIYLRENYSFSMTLIEGHMSCFMLFERAGLRSYLCDCVIKHSDNISSQCNRAGGM